MVLDQKLPHGPQTVAVVLLTLLLTLLLTVLLTVLLSVIAHGLSAPEWARRYGSWAQRQG